jgi:hypothetical protein
MNMQRVKLGRMFQKSGGLISRTPRKFSTQIDFARSRRSTFALLERAHEIVQKSIEPNPDAGWTSSFAPRDFCTHGDAKVGTEERAKWVQSVMTLQLGAHFLRPSHPTQPPTLSSTRGLAPAG